MLLMWSGLSLSLIDRRPLPLCVFVVVVLAREHPIT